MVVVAQEEPLLAAPLDEPSGGQKSLSVAYRRRMQIDPHITVAEAAGRMQAHHHLPDAAARRFWGVWGFGGCREGAGSSSAEQTENDGVRSSQARWRELM